MASKTDKHSKSRQDESESRACRTKPELAEFFDSVDERMKSLAIARKPYKARNTKELSVKPGDIFEVLDDDGVWWCLRAPSGKAGHVPKSHLQPILNSKTQYGRSYDSSSDRITVKVSITAKTPVQQESDEKIGRPRTPSARHEQKRLVTRSVSPFPISAPPPAENRPLSQLPPKMSPSRWDRSPATRTYVKEPGRRSPESSRKHRNTRSSSHRPHRFSRSSSSSSSSSDDNSTYENQPRKSHASRVIHKSRAHIHRSPSGCKGHIWCQCREVASRPVRHSCPVQCVRDKRSSHTPPQSPARNDASPDNQSQQVITIIELPRQEQTPVEVEQATTTEEYQQNTPATAPVQILVPQAVPFTFSMNGAPQYPQYGQAVQQTSMQMPWFSQPYYPTYA